MLRKIYRELVTIRKELQAIRSSLEPSKEADAFVAVREPYSSRIKYAKSGPDGAVDAT